MLSACNVFSTIIPIGTVCYLTYFTFCVCGGGRAFWMFALSIRLTTGLNSVQGHGVFITVQ